jgi:hypothetical protein
MARVKRSPERTANWGLGHAPLARRHNPRSRSAVQDQEEEFSRVCLVAGVMSPGPNCPAQLGIERLDGIRGVQNAADVGGKSIERDDLAPGAAPSSGRSPGISGPKSTPRRAVSAASPAAASTVR